jgi:hypothetical protein
MSAMQTTPETDAEISKAWEAVGISPALVPAEFCRKLERERDEARTDAARQSTALCAARGILCDAMPDINAPTADLVRALVVERDSARILAGELIASIRINAKHGTFATATVYELEEWLVPFVARLNPALGVECDRRGKKSEKSLKKSLREFKTGGISLA